MAEKGSARRADDAIRAGGNSHAFAADPHIAQNSDAHIRVVLTGSHAASACGLTVDLGSRRRGSPICKLARLLVEAGHDPDAPVHIYRDGTLCFRPMPLWRWAGLTIEEGASDSARFRAWRPMPSARRAVARITGLSDPSGGEAPGGRSGGPAGLRRSGRARND